MRASFRPSLLIAAVSAAGATLSGPMVIAKPVNICAQVAEVIKAQLPQVPAKDRTALLAICRRPNLTTDRKARIIALWLKNKVHPSATLYSDKSPSYWLYNELVGFRKGLQPKRSLSFWPQERGGSTYVRYPFGKANPLRIGDQIKMGQGLPAPVSYHASSKGSGQPQGQYFRMPQQPRPLSDPYITKGYAASLADLSRASARIIPVGNTRIEYLQFFDVNDAKVNQLLTQLLLSPHPTAEKTLLDLRGPTGSVQTDLANLLPTYFQQIEKTVKKRDTYVLVDRYTEGFKLILARFLQNKGAIVMGEPQAALPGYARFFPLVTQQPAEYYLMQLPKASKIYKGMKRPVIDTPLPNHLPFSNGVDTMLEKALAFLK